MRRRTVLRSAAAAGTVGTALAGGCLAGSGDDGAGGNGGDRNDTSDGNDGVGGDDVPGENSTGEDGEDGTDGDVEWRHDVGGTVRAVANGLVIGHEDFTDEDGDGGVFALDAGTGDHEWTFGRSGGYTGYTRPAVDDAVYVGFGDDAIGSESGEVYALEFDGELRWSRETGSVYSRPKLGDGVVYAGSDDGVVRAFDREDGDVRWSQDGTERLGEDGFGVETDVVAVDDAVYVADGRLVALDPDDGAVRWDYGDEDDRIRDATVVDGTAYVTARDRVAAVSKGKERWSVPSDTAWIRAVAADRAFVRRGDGLRVFDLEGEERWGLEDLGRFRLAVEGNVAYVGGSNDDRLRAVDVADGTERWSEDVDGALEGVVLADDERDRGAYVQAGDSRLVRFDPDGETTWEATLDEEIRNYAVDDGRVYVGARTGISALEID